MTDHIDHTLDILKDIDIPETDYAKATRVQFHRASFVASEPFRGVVLPAIQFDDEPAFVTCKIDNERTNWNLATKVSPFLLEHAQFVPELYSASVTLRRN